MLTDERVKLIQQLRGTTHFSIPFIKQFDIEWSSAVDRLKRSKANLGKIRLTSKSEEYKNVRT